MGDIAELIYTGKQCSLCGIEFIEPHGYPVVCEECWKELTEEEQDSYVKATNEEL